MNRKMPSLFASVVAARKQAQAEAESANIVAGNLQQQQRGVNVQNPSGTGAVHYRNANNLMMSNANAAYGSPNPYPEHQHPQYQQSYSNSSHSYPNPSMPSRNVAVATATSRQSYGDAYNAAALALQQQQMQHGYQHPQPNYNPARPTVGGGIYYPVDFSPKKKQNDFLSSAFASRATPDDKKRNQSQNAPRPQASPIQMRSLSNNSRSPLIASYGNNMQVSNNQIYEQGQYQPPHSPPPNHFAFDPAHRATVSPKRYGNIATAVAPVPASPRVDEQSSGFLASAFASRAKSSAPTENQTHPRFDGGNSDEGQDIDPSILTDLARYIDRLNDSKSMTTPTSTMSPHSYLDKSPNRSYTGTNISPRASLQAHNQLSSPLHSPTNKSLLVPVSPPAMNQLQGVSPIHPSNVNFTAFATRKKHSPKRQQLFHQDSDIVNENETNPEILNDLATLIDSMNQKSPARPLLEDKQMTDDPDLIDNDDNSISPETDAELSSFIESITAKVQHSKAVHQDIPQVLTAEAEYETDLAAQIAQLNVMVGGADEKLRFTDLNDEESDVPLPQVLNDSFSILSESMNELPEGASKEELQNLNAFVAKVLQFLELGEPSKDELEVLFDDAKGVGIDESMILDMVRGSKEERKSSRSKKNRPLKTTEKPKPSSRAASKLERMIISKERMILVNSGKYDITEFWRSPWDRRYATVKGKNLKRRKTLGSNTDGTMDEVPQLKSVKAVRKFLQPDTRPSAKGKKLRTQVAQNWKLSIADRKAAHDGFKGVHSLFNNNPVSTNVHSFDMIEWDDRVVDQGFMDFDITQTNWFGKSFPALFFLMS